MSILNLLPFTVCTLFLVKEAFHKFHTLITLVRCFLKRWSVTASLFFLKPMKLQKSITPSIHSVSFRLVRLLLHHQIIHSLNVFSVFTPQQTCSPLCHSYLPTWQKSADLHRWIPGTKLSVGMRRQRMRIKYYLKNSEWAFGLSTSSEWPRWLLWNSIN